MLVIEVNTDKHKEIAEQKERNSRAEQSRAEQRMEGVWASLENQVRNLLAGAAGARWQRKRTSCSLGGTRIRPVPAVQKFRPIFFTPENLSPSLLSPSIFPKKEKRKRKKMVLKVKE